MRIRAFIPFLLALSLAAHSSAQEILTAENFLASVADVYGPIKDYSADIVITSGESVMDGALIHKSPNLLRIDFVSPKDQVISYNGDTLTVYLPDYRAVLTQSVSSTGSRTGASLASKQGLSLLRKNYTVAYTVGPDPVPLDEGSAESVVKLSLVSRSASEGFSSLALSVTPGTLLIRRIEGTTIAGETVTFDFTNIVLNQGIPEARFVYDSPASANMYNNFLFKDND